MDSLIDLLVDNPLLLLFVVVAIGYPIGTIRIAGSSLGVASVLFAGLAMGALDPELKLPEIIYLLGLVLFVYTVGLSNGPGFFASFRYGGVRDNLLVVAVLVFGAGLVVGVILLLGMRATLAVGMFAGSLTNTPALAAVLEYLNQETANGNLEQLLAEPVVGYSVAYPFGVVGMILAIAFFQRYWSIDYQAEARRAHGVSSGEPSLASRTIRVTNPAVAESTVQDLIDRNGWDVVFGRIAHDGELRLVGGASRLLPGDLVSVVGRLDEVDRVTAALGEESAEELSLDRSELDYRRIFVSDRRIAGHRLRDLDLPRQYGALVTRVRRGDLEFVPNGDTVLELGDRVRVVTRRNMIAAVTRFFGDSYRSLSEIDLLTFSLGLALGLLLGAVPIPLPGGITLRLGLAGGPLVVALILGARERSGPLVWTLPYSANLTLRQFGLILFLAGVGTRSGYAFKSMVFEGSGLQLLLAGAMITSLAAGVTLWVGYRLLNIPMALLVGMLAGLQTQPAVLGYALEQAKNELPNVGYATVYPVATIGKIVLAQILITAFL